MRIARPIGARPFAPPVARWTAEQREMSTGYGILLVASALGSATGRRFIGRPNQSNVCRKYLFDSDTLVKW